MIWNKDNNIKKPTSLSSSASSASAAVSSCAFAKLSTAMAKNTFKRVSLVTVKEQNMLFMQREFYKTN